MKTALTLIHLWAVTHQHIRPIDTVELPKRPRRAP